MREASFLGMFVGIETPEADALKAMRKNQNVAVPMMESIKTLNDYGLEVTSGIILGLDTDSDDTESAAQGLHRHLAYPDADHQSAAGAAEDAAVGPAQAWRDGCRMIRRSKATCASCGHTTRWCRCGAAASPMPTIRSGCSRASITRSNSTYVNRMIPPARGKLNWANLSGALVLAFRVVLHIGILSDYRKPFWRAARHALRRGQIDAVLGMGFIAHHLIQFTREALRGEQNASYYSTKLRTAEPAQTPELATTLRKSA